MSRPPVLADIARLAGTSVATVSRVLSQSGSVSSETTERVRRAISDTGFVLNTRRSAAMRGRFRRQTLKHGALGVICSNDPVGEGSPSHSHTQTQVRAAVLDSFLHAADDAGIRVVMCRVSSESLDQGATPPSLREAGVDGFLSQAAVARNYLGIETIAPIVFFGNHPTPFCPIPSVEPETSLAMAAIIQHLCDLHHRRYLFLSPEIDGERIHQSFAQRCDAFLAATKMRGCAAEIHPLPRAGGLDHFMPIYMGRPPSERPTALVCANDGLAAQVVTRLIAGGIRVPEDVSVTGFDGMTTAAVIGPELTTWLPDWRLIGRKSFEVLLARIRGETVPVRTLVGGRLCIRGSTGPVRNEGA